MNNIVQGYNYGLLLKNYTTQQHGISVWQDLHKMSMHIHQQKQKL